MGNIITSLLDPNDVSGGLDELVERLKLSYTSQIPIFFRFMFGNYSESDYNFSIQLYAVQPITFTICLRLKL